MFISLSVSNFYYEKQCCAPRAFCHWSGSTDPASRITGPDQDPWILILLMPSARRLASGRCRHSIFGGPIWLISASTPFLPPSVPYLVTVSLQGGGGEGKSLAGCLVGRKRKGEDLSTVPAKKRGRPAGGTRYRTCYQCSGSGLDPHSNRRLDPDPYSIYGSGSTKSNVKIYRLCKFFMIFTFNKKIIP